MVQKEKKSHWRDLRKNETQNITVRESTEKQTLQKQYSLSGSL